MPSRRLAEKAVERFGLLQVHGFPSPAHVGLKTRKTGNADSATGLAKFWQRQEELCRAAGRLLVAGIPVRHLLLRAEHLFVAATVGCGRRAADRPTWC